MAGVAPGPAAPSREGAPWSHPRYASRCKTSARKYTGLQVEASLQLSVYAYATAMNGLADQEDLRLRFDVLTKTMQPELHRYWTQRARAANVRFFHLAAEILRAIEGWCVRAEPGLAVQGLPVPEPVLGGGSWAESVSGFVALTHFHGLPLPAWLEAPHASGRREEPRAWRAPGARIGRCLRELSPGEPARRERDPG